jgi:exopolysaccharide biosynthesis polyprenyl glycosylphosphotransferase
VNFMSELNVNRFWPAEPEFGSQYARMIPGSAATAPPASVIPIDDGANRLPGKAAAPCAGARWRLTARKVAQFLVPHPEAADRFALFRLVAADLIVLLGASFLPSLVFPGWALPLATVPVYVVLVTLFGLREGLYENSAQTLAAAMPALAKSVLFATILIFIVAREGTPLLAFPATLTTSLASLAGWRYLIAVRQKRRANAADIHNVLIVGAGPAAWTIARALWADPLQRYDIRGFVDDHLSPAPAVLGRIEDLEWLARADFVDEVIVALPNQPAQAREAAAIAYRNHLDIRMVLDLPPGSWPDAAVERIGGIPVITLHQEALPGASLFVKRSLDIAGALACLVIAGPVMAVVAWLIRFDSPGPAIYSADRTGAKGRHFHCFKFRSMVSDADRTKDSLRARNLRVGPTFKVVDDPRITRVGRFLRRYSLDELPQLWNVLRGDMSLVGPRPHPIDDVKRYELHHFRRLDVKPGITGLWQVMARSNPSFELNMHLDLTYIENWTLLLDLRILMRTVRVLFAPEGA